MVPLGFYMFVGGGVSVRYVYSDIDRAATNSEKWPVCAYPASGASPIACSDVTWVSNPSGTCKRKLTRENTTWFRHNDLHLDYTFLHATR